MLANKVKVMLYVENVLESSLFWQRMGFVEKEREEVDGTTVVEIAPSETSESIIVLYDLHFIQQHSPEVVSNAPSMMFFAKEIECLYKKVKEEGIRVGELTQLPTGLVFNFLDNEGNYFVISEEQ